MENFKVEIVNEVDNTTKQLATFKVAILGEAGKVNRFN